MTIPKEVDVRSTRAIVMPAGSSFVTIPLPKVLHEEKDRWLITKHDIKELKAIAEKVAGEDRFDVETDILYTYV
ncbi:MAG: hypothetical protein ACUVUB_03255 [Candidatus Bathyarchaeia archaeon]